MEVKMHWGQKVFLATAVVNIVTSLIDHAWPEALWTALAIMWCLQARAFEKEATAWK